MEERKAEEKMAIDNNETLISILVAISSKQRKDCDSYAVERKNDRSGYHRGDRRL